jgi:hypothetical protein
MSTAVVHFDLPKVGGHRSFLVRVSSAAPATLSALLKAGVAWQSPEGGRVRADLASGTLDADIVRDLREYLYGDDSVNAARLHRHFAQLAVSGLIQRYVARPGATAVGHELVGRDGVLSRMRGLIDQGSSLHLKAPRRYGKTSVLTALTEEVSKTRPVLLVDVASAGDPQGLVVKLIAAVLAAPSMAGIARKLGVANPGQARQLVQREGVAVLRHMLEALGAIHCVLCLDEISLLLRGALGQHESDAEWRLMLELLKAGRADVPQVFAGSTGLSSFAELHGLGEYLNHLLPVQLEPLEPAIAEWLIEEMLLSDERRPEPGLAAAILNLVGAPVPFFLHAFADGLRSMSRAQEVVGIEHANQLYSRWISGSAGQNLFVGYRLCNQPYPPGCRTTARELLGMISASADGASMDLLCEAFQRNPPAGHDARLEGVLACLSEDYDLEERNGGWAFRSKLVRERWLQGDAWLTRA